MPRMFDINMPVVTHKTLEKPAEGVQLGGTDLERFALAFARQHAPRAAEVVKKVFFQYYNILATAGNIPPLSREALEAGLKEIEHEEDYRFLRQRVALDNPLYVDQVERIAKMQGGLLSLAHSPSLPRTIGFVVYRALEKELHGKR